MRRRGAMVPLLVGLAAGRAPALQAQVAGPLRDPPAFRLDQWTTDNGLPQNSVTALAQSPGGFLWIGTFGGLVRFDGTTFRLVERHDSLGGHVDRILSLAVAPDGALWIGTESNGLLRYREGRYDGFTVADGLPDNTIPVLFVDRDGGLWIGGQRGGVVRRAAGGFRPVVAGNGAPLDQVVSFGQARDGTLWVNTAGTYVEVDRDAMVTRSVGRAREPGAIRRLLEDARGRVWYGLPNGVVVRSSSGARRYGAGAGVPRTALMLENPDGGYWLGTDNDGVFYFDPDAGVAHAHRYPLPDGRFAYRVRTGLVDSEGNVWLGTNARGLLRVKRNVFTTYTAEHGLSNDVGTAVLVDAAGVVWAGTNCWGLNALDLTRHTVRVFKPRIPGDPAGDPCVFALAESPPGTLWIGTYGGGLTRLANGRAERLRSAGLRDSVVLALFADREGAVWVGTNGGGLARLGGEGRVVASYTTAEGLADNSVRVIAQSRDSALWVGTLGGVSRLAHGRITNYTAATGLSTAHVRALYQDADGAMWIGTYGGGLHRLRNDTVVSVTTRDGLADDVVSAILEDDAGYFWMSGNRGIQRVARADLTAFLDGRRPLVHAVLYGMADGLGSAETNGGFQPAGWKDARGRLWFPTVQGVAMVDPARLPVAVRPPPVEIAEVLVDGMPVPAAAPLRLGPGRPNLEIRYSALSLSSPEQVVFRYRLEGYDDRWVQVSGRRVAYYSRLPPGRYRFTVGAANRDGVWNDAGATLALHVLAPFWRTLWFRSVAGVCVAVLAAVWWARREAAARRARQAQEAFARTLIESQEHERRRLAGELHDGLGQELLVVKNRALLALRAEGLDGVREQLRHISDVASQSLENVRALAHTLTPRQLDHLGLSDALRTMIESVAATSNLTVDLDVKDVDDAFPVDGQINLYRVVQEALSNVVHHAGASTATIRVVRRGAAVRVEIHDDGRGFTVQRDERGQVTGGFGLSSIAERVRMLGGRVAVVSGPGRGTHIEVLVPVAPTAGGPPV